MSESTDLSTGGASKDGALQGKSRFGIGDGAGFTRWRDYIDPRFLGAVSTPGVLNLSRPQNTTCWSGDNQVALVTDGGGVTIVDFVHTHEELESGVLRFIGSETKLACTKPKDKNLENYVGVPFSRLVQNRDKNEVFEVVRDPIICPKDMINAETQLYYTKVSWSPRPFQLTRKGDGGGEVQYVLAALDSHFHFRLFTKRQSAGDGEEEGTGGMEDGEDWQVFIDLTESFRQLLLSQFWSINVEDEATFAAKIFKEYKGRMYELAAVDFMWLPKWDEEFEGDHVAGLVTAHASGDICIWHLCSNNPSSNVWEGEEAHHLNYFLTLEFRKKLTEGEIVSLLDFYKLSSTLGLLVIGTTAGSLKVFKMRYNSIVARAMKIVPTDEEPQPQKYFLEEEAVLCEKDLLEVQVTLGEVNELEDVEGHRVTLYVFKHPNFMQPFELELCVNEPMAISCQRLGSPVRVVNGVLTGAALIRDYQDPDKIVLLTVTQRGILSWLDVEDGKIRQVSSYDLGSGDDSGNNTGAVGGRDLVKKRLQFGGLTVSPNRTMICVSKTLAEYYDHLALRNPCVLQFHSLFPSENVWPFVYTKCVENQFQLQKMGDVLTAYRVIMSASEAYLKEVLDWAVPLKSKSLQDLQILFWILRIQQRGDKDQLALAFNLRKEEPTTFLQLKHKRNRAIRRETLVSDKIIHLRCLDLVRKVIENPAEYDLEGNLLNLQSLLTMYGYLETKKDLIKEKEGLPRKPRVLVDPPPRKPACPLCSKPTKVLDVSSIERRWVEGEDFTVEHEIDAEEIDGVLWHEQQHTQKSRSHPISCCILSLVPISFPYRKCLFCGTICMKNPSFGQEPLCPFCNGGMESPAGYYEEEELAEESEDLQKLMLEIEREQEKAVTQRKKDAPLARKTRIEKMYID